MVEKSDEVKDLEQVISGWEANKKHSLCGHCVQTGEVYKQGAEYLLQTEQNVRNMAEARLKYPGASQIPSKNEELKELRDLSRKKYLEAIGENEPVDVEPVRQMPDPPQPEPRRVGLLGGVSPLGLRKGNGPMGNVKDKMRMDTDQNGSIGPFGLVPSLGFRGGLKDIRSGMMDMVPRPRTWFARKERK